MAEPWGGDIEVMTAVGSVRREMGTPRGRADGTVKCWGYNQEGQLGYGDQTTRNNGANLPAVDLGGGMDSC
ncbi:hypothetical protein T484DRAFT_1848560 [Baffinella frigidus]|nr:hypothetical protein T484DRAFT_1848560 [Cryptophyta sp. CCMP2293]